MSLLNAASSKGDKALQTVSKQAVPKGKLEEAVFKATQSKEKPSKPKHIRTVVNETWTNPGRVFDEILKRPLASKEVALYKSLVLIHYILREGHPQSLSEASNRENMFTSFGDQYKSAASQYGQAISAYTDLIINKITFHKAHPQIKGDISVQEYKSRQSKFDPKSAYTLVAHLLEVQKACMVYQQKALQSQNLNTCKLSGVVPTLKESYAVYTLTVAVLQDLVDKSESSAINTLIDTFVTQYPVIYKFYFTCASIPYLTQQLSIPSLPRDPPNFAKKPELPPAKLPPPKEKKPAAPKPKPVVTQTTTTTNYYQQSPPPTAQFYQTIQSIGSITGDLLSFSQQQQQQQQQQQPQDVFMTNSQMQQYQQQFPTQPTPAPAPAPTATVNPFLTSSTSGNPFMTLQGAGLSNVVPAAPTTIYPSVEPERITKFVDPSETREALEAKIYQLESKHTTLLTELRVLKDDHEKLLDELNRGDKGLADARAEMEYKLQSQQAEFLADQKAIRDHLELTSKKYATEKLKLVSDQVGFSKNAVDQSLMRFDDPNFLGNRTATAEDVVNSSYKMQESFNNLVEALATEGDIVGTSRILAADTEKFLADVKGLMNRVDDPELKLQLGEAARNVAKMVSKLLSDAQDLSAKGKPSDAVIDGLRYTQNVFEGQLAEVRNVINNQANKSQVEQDNNLDDLAERELMNAAKIIEDAAASLRAQAADRKAQMQFGPGDIDAEGAIADSALHITTAIQRLIIAATAAQQERVAKGLVAPPGSDLYHSDAVWAEGLISAAKAVAHATKLLVGSANKAIQGSIDEATLQACCKAVVAHTAHLQSATKAKSDYHSKSAQGVENAAKSVKEATNSLVNQTKKVAFNKEQVASAAAGNSFGNIKAEMELETNIQRLKAQIESANKELFAFRKRGYDDARANAPVKTIPTPVNAKQPATYSSDIDTSSIANPFGGGGSSLKDIEKTLVPSYMTKKVDSAVAPVSKIDLSSKPPLEVKPRPFHLQGDIVSPRSATTTLPPPPASPRSVATPSGFGATTTLPPPSPRSAGFGATTLPPPPVQSTPNPFLGSGSGSAMPPPPTASNPFLSNPANPFM
eukprot:TRINITY_DN491_c0_g1_i1.p1 TRINITY_DN491_c0_g1~~TRINITY_DN491_c0_g1_i1.p1  ORF type:complete len:1099 (+),score=324.41 TRINITY_DN491_c0_g1_i1:26-3298(+)